MSETLSTKQIVFIGAGSMAEAIIRGLLHNEKVAARQILALNHSNLDQLRQLQSNYNIQVGTISDTAAETLRQADILILAMKPKDAGIALANLRNIVHEKQLIISIIAGLSLHTIKRLLQSNAPIVRTMPNTSCTIGMGSTGISFADEVTDQQQLIACEIFASIGQATIVKEELLDIVTGVSGCGPAYVYYLMEAMIAGGIQGGLNAEEARQLTIQTVLGAASMVTATGESPSTLRQKVTSPNGATQAALDTLNQYNFSSAVEKAVLRAAERSQELGEMIAAKHS